MMITRRVTRLLALGLFPLLALACTAQQEAKPFTPPEPTAAPDIAATVTARDRALSQGGPEPTPVPASVSQAAGEFAAAYATLSQEWDGVHRDLDTWRQGLTSCDASSVRVALRGFSGDFSGVSSTAAGLSRHPSVRSHVRPANRSRPAGRRSPSPVAGHLATGTARPRFGARVRVLFFVWKQGKQRGIGQG